jgi:hypothetical protein
LRCKSEIRPEKLSRIKHIFLHRGIRKEFLWEQSY